MTILGQIARGINFDPAGGFAQGQNEAQVSLQNNMNLLNQVEARARQRQIPGLVQRTLMGDPEASSQLLVAAPKTFETLATMQQAPARMRQQQLNALPPRFIETALFSGVDPVQASQDVINNPQLAEQLFNRSRTLRKPLVQQTFEGDQPVNFREKARQEAFGTALSEQEKQAVKGSETFRQDLAKKARQSGETLLQLRQFENALLRGGRTGPVVESTLGFRRFLSAIGALTPEEDQRLGDEELLASLGNRMQLAMSEFMKGAISEREQDIMRATVPNLTNTKEGNFLIIEVMREMARRQKIVSSKVSADFRRARTNNQIFDAQESAERHAAELDSRAPIFEKKLLTRMTRLSSNPSALINIWNQSPEFISRLRESGVFPTDETAEKLATNPRNVGQLVIIGNRIGRITKETQ